jgi:hypothetical protein
MPSQARQANFGRCLTITRYWGRDYIEPLRTVFADHRHRCPAARAAGILRCQHDIDTRQMRRQHAPAGTTLRRTLPAQIRIVFLCLGSDFSNRLFEVLKC